MVMFAQLWGDCLEMQTHESLMIGNTKLNFV